MDSFIASLAAVAAAAATVARSSSSGGGGSSSSSAAATQQQQQQQQQRRRRRRRRQQPLQQQQLIHSSCVRSFAHSLTPFLNSFYSFRSFFHLMDYRQCPRARMHARTRLPGRSGSLGPGLALCSVFIMGRAYPITITARSSPLPPPLDHGS